MRNAKVIAIAIFLIATTALAGIEVLSPAELLGIEVLSNGYDEVTVFADVPAGSTAEAVVQTPGASEIVVDIAPVDPVSGVAVVLFPPMPTGTSEWVRVRDPNGELLGAYAEEWVVE